MRTMLRSKITLLFMTLGLVLAVAGVAYADNLVDELSGDATSGATQTITAGDSVGFTNDYWIVANRADGSAAGCDVGVAGDNITATFSWPATGAGSLPSDVSASTSSITFDECQDGSDKNEQSVTFTSDKSGTYTIPAPSKSDGTGVYSTSNTSFKLVVNDDCPSGDTSGNLQDGKCTANTAPTASGQLVSTNEDIAKTITLSGSDADGNNLGFSITDSPDHGSLGTIGTPVCNATTKVCTADVTYTPTSNYNGTDSFGFKVNDGTVDSTAATVSITVNAVNDAPVAANNSYSTNEDTLLSVAAPGVLGNDSDVEGSSLSAVLVSGPSHAAANGFTLNANGSFSYTPAANYNGSDSFTYKANDGSADSTAATVSITVNPVNDPPTATAQSVATDEDNAKAITLSGNDVDGDSLTYSVVSGPSNGALSGTAPNLTYTPDGDYNGSDSFTFKVNDGSVDSAAATVSITVNAVNDDPVITSVTGGPVNEGSPATITVNATDVDNTASQLRYRFDCNNDGTYDAAAQAGNTYQCTFNDDGTSRVNVEVTDGAGGSDTDYTNVQVDNVTPVVTATTAAQSAVEGTATSFSLGSFTDPGNDSPWEVTVDWGDNSTDTTFTAANAGTLAAKSHTYADEGTGTYTVTVTVAEAGGTPSHSDTFQVSVTNALPVVSGLSVSSSTNQVACLTGGNAIKLGFSFSDLGTADTHSYSINWGDNSANTGLNPATSPAVDVGHTYSGLGPYTITVTVTDNDGGSGQGSPANPVSFHYNIGSTMLSPVNLDNTSIFKLGNTIPVKVNITDCSGAGVSGLAPTIKMLKIASNPANTGEIEVTSTQPNDTNGVMRDLGSGQYIYNLASSSLVDSTAMYKSVVTHNGYSVTSTNYFSLKAK